MATKQFIFDFYSCDTNVSQANVTQQNSHQVFQNLLDTFQASPEGTVKDVGRHLLEIRDIRATTYGFKGIFGKHRRNNLPHAAVAGGTERELPLAPNENLLEKAHFTFYTQNSLLVIQRNRFCANADVLGHFLSPANHVTMLNPIIEPASLAWLANNRVRVKVAKINVAKPRNPELLRELNHDFNNSLLNTLNGTNSAQLNLVFRGDTRSDDPEERYLDNSFKRALRELQETLDVTKLDLTTENEDTMVEHPIDLVSDRLKHFDNVSMNGRYPDSFDMWDKLEDAKNTKQDELNNFFGLPGDQLD
ncbi:DUF6731 family protein [Vibrio europaeus]|uniref:DUF6731 family protein n=1 Tax=Vibrio europaeus TaxID=300876 RepID=UPI00233EC7C0|nr:DUF6731 family protein [Vibrio europaeus]MDC5717857.1 hypothetical protein [Vibrio europaeus]